MNHAYPILPSSPIIFSFWISLNNHGGLLFSHWPEGTRSIVVDSCRLLNSSIIRILCTKYIRILIRLPHHRSVQILRRWLIKNLASTSLIFSVHIPGLFGVWYSFKRAISLSILFIGYHLLNLLMFHICRVNCVFWILILMTTNLECRAISIWHPDGALLLLTS